MRLALLTALALALVASPAAANPTRLTEEVRLAQAFWADRNVTGCPAGITITVLDLGLTEAEGGACQVRLSTRLVAQRRLRIECTMVVHEVGHALGLEHTPTGLMAVPIEEVPYDCERWARDQRARQSVRKQTPRIGPLKGVLR